METLLIIFIIQTGVQTLGFIAMQMAWEYCEGKYNKDFVNNANRLYRLIKDYFHEREFLHTDVVGLVCNYSTLAKQYDIKTLYVAPFSDLNYVDELFRYLIEQKIIAPCKNNYYKIVKFY